MQTGRTAQIPEETPETHQNMHISKLNRAKKPTWQLGRCQDRCFLPLRPRLRTSGLTREIRRTPPDAGPSAHAEVVEKCSLGGIVGRGASWLMARLIDATRLLPGSWCLRGRERGRGGGSTRRFLFYFTIIYTDI